MPYCDDMDITTEAVIDSQPSLVCFLGVIVSQPSYIMAGTLQVLVTVCLVCAV